MQLRMEEVKERVRINERDERGRRCIRLEFIAGNAS